MYTFSIHQAKSRLSELIRLVLSGEDVFIAKGGSQPLVKLIPAPQAEVHRELGRLANDPFSMAEDFDAPLEDFADYMG